MINIGSVDRVIRIILGIVLITLPLLTTILEGWGNWKYLSLIVGAVMIGTALFRFCPAYKLFGIRTCSIRKK
ncbi:YgaP family membrane protein [Pseudochrobactrum sp. HB0163]|uniref:YgaP family membrane protein n=1 Tax=Pseudochrobactrum sp. HB0163 TaxID=3450708 RepID=UPI003F6DA829